jgi:hypothetical protein
MQTPNNDLKEHLTRCRQIKISVIGRKSGKTISIPVWFVLEGEKLSLLPVRGSDTQWLQEPPQCARKCLDTADIVRDGDITTVSIPHSRNRPGQRCEPHLERLTQSVDALSTTPDKSRQVTFDEMECPACGVRFQTAPPPAQ